MAAHWHSVSDKVRILYDDVTGSRGLQVSVVAGEAVSKGNIVCYKQGATANKVYLVPTSGNSNDMPQGVIYEDIAQDATGWMWVNGVCQVLPESTLTATLGYVLITSKTEAGRALDSASAPAVGDHFREVGHWTETGSGNGALTKAIIHFN